MPSETTFYVYALKDPRTSPARAFYIGKGTGTRSFDHLVKPDNTRKGQRIQEIQAEGKKVLVERLVDGLSQAQSLRLEAELIAAFGTIDTDGLLTNSVMPSALGRRSKVGLVVPSGAKEKAQVGLDLLKDAVLDLARANPDGITNGETASVLGLKSDYGGGVKDYLSYSVLGILMREGKVERDAEKGRGKHVARVR
jgi:uncharacterized protein